MGYGIHRVAKVKANGVGGLQKENCRKEEMQAKYERTFSEGIDWSKTNENIYLVKCDSWKQTIKEELKAHGIEKWRKDATLLLDGLYTASPEDMQSWDDEKRMSYFQKCVEFHECHYGPVISAVIHRDESNDHLHVESVPLIQKADGNWKLCAKDMTNGKACLAQIQTDFYEEVGKEFELKRGESRSKAVHRDELDRLRAENARLREQNSEYEEAIEFQQDSLNSIEKRIELNEGVIEQQRSAISDQNDRIRSNNAEINRQREVAEQLDYAIEDRQAYEEFSQQYDRAYREAHARKWGVELNRDDYEMEL